MHEGRQYQVEELDFDDKKAYVRHVDVDYYTDANLSTSLKVLDEFESRPSGKLTRARGEVLLSSIVTLFKKIKFDTHENLGWGPVTLPELEMQTSACWWSLPETPSIPCSQEELQTALVGLANLIRNIAPLYLMCAPQDLSVHYHVKDPYTNRPTIYACDHIPGGVGLSDNLYELDREIFVQALQLLEECPCEFGCPSCVGAGAEGGKQRLIALLRDWLA